MSDVVKLLELLATHAAPLSEEAYARMVADADLDAAVRDAMLRRDVEALSRALGGRAAMFCAVFPAENEPEPNEDEPQQDDEETPREGAALAA